MFGAALGGRAFRDRRLHHGGIRRGRGGPWHQELPPWLMERVVDVAPVTAAVRRRDRSLRTRLLRRRSTVSGRDDRGPGGRRTGGRTTLGADKEIGGGSRGQGSGTLGVVQSRRSRSDAEPCVPGTPRGRQEAPGADPHWARGSPEGPRGLDCSRRGARGRVTR